MHNSRQRKKEAEERAALEARQGTLEGRLQQLCEAARLSESSFKRKQDKWKGGKEVAMVNGQVWKARAARPKSAHDYRRVWKERPQGFPLREASSDQPHRGSPGRAYRNKSRIVIDQWHRCAPEKASDTGGTGGIDPGREVIGLFDRANHTHYVSDYCAPETSAALGLLDYARQVRGLPDRCIAPDFDPLWEHHRDVTHQDLSTSSKFPLEVAPKPTLPKSKRQLPRGVRDFIQGDSHLKGLVKREGFV